MKILLCIGIIILMGLIGFGVYMVCRIAACQYLQTQMMMNVSQNVPPGGAGNGNALRFEGLHIWDEVPNCTLMMQCYFNQPKEFYIVDFSSFTEDNKLVGLQLFDTRRIPGLDCTEPMLLENITFRKISDEGEPEEESHWLWYFPEQESWS